MAFVNLVDHLGTTLGHVLGVQRRGDKRAWIDKKSTSCWDRRMGVLNITWLGLPIILSDAKECKKWMVLGQCWEKRMAKRCVWRFFLLRQSLEKHPQWYCRVVYMIFPAG